MSESLLELNGTFVYNCQNDISHNVPLLEHITHYNVDQLSYQDFFYNHMVVNSPCIINGITQNWHNLMTENGAPNMMHLESFYGSTLVPVANCGEKFYNAQKKEEMKLRDYLSYWKMYRECGYSKETPCLYLKDWHFTRDFPEANIYRVPKYFASDWLNEYFTSRTDINDDYRFVYMGPKGSWTPFHADVFSSYSWSVNICGKKRWVLFPPGEEKCLTDNHGNLVYDVESPKLNNPDSFPNYHKLEKKYEVIQNAGDAIFVPSGWHHQVWNLEDTISVNHNWINGCNIDKMWNSIRRNLEAVKLEISDCRDMENWEEHCQLMLNATFGLNYPDFCKFLLFIIDSRLPNLHKNTALKVFGDWLLSESHLTFDLSRAKQILLQLLCDDDFIKLNYFLENDHSIRVCLNEIDNILIKK